MAREIPTDAEKSRYRHKDIKNVLHTETHGKCAYCESFLDHIAFGDVEHISPKSQKLSDTFRWGNLTLACDKCNTYKANTPDILDPYVDDPEAYLLFLGPLVYPLPNLIRGVITVKQLRLNRVGLIQNRTKRLQVIADQILLIKETKDPTLKLVLVNDLLENETGDDTEFAAFVRSFLKSVEPELTIAATQPEEVSEQAQL